LTTDFYIVAVEPKKNSNFSVFTDNSGGESSGKYRYGFGYNDLSLSGRCDILSLTALFSKSSKTGMLSYNTPVGYSGNRLSISHNSNNMKVSKGYMKDLDVKGSSRSNSISFTKPIKTTISKRNEVIFDIQQQKSVTKILGNDFVRDRDSRYSIAYSSMIIKRNQIYFFKPTYIYNQHKNIDGEHFHGDRITLDTMWQKYEMSGNTLTLRVSAQKELDSFIPSTDQYYLGGQYSVRGYHENVIGGDAGVNAKFDYSIHLKKNGLNFVTFFDWGRLNGDTILTTKEIYSAGFGFEYQHKNLYASIYTGYPLKRKIGDQETDKSITHFTLSYSF
ncbi:MAG: ShlB/FhaC/HecB family hemolysin secretion/activation protein, partial [Candidatus Riflebacteria bacterium]|nr:ShlB/FhaC/HecB family hemolysin secretion/activation protein [Candidatus Riflebacteria bacterium]